MIMNSNRSKWVFAQVPWGIKECAISLGILATYYWVSLFIAYGLFESWTNYIVVPAMRVGMSAIMLIMVFYHSGKKLYIFGTRISSIRADVSWVIMLAIIIFNFIMPSEMYLSSNTYRNLWYIGAPNYVYIPNYVLAVIIVPIAEEIFFRGYIYRALRNKYSYKLSIIICAVIFAIMHFRYREFIPLFVIGVIFTYMYEKSRNIYVPIVAHTLLQIAASTASLSAQFGI